MFADSPALAIVLFLLGSVFFLILHRSWRYRTEPGGRWWVLVVAGMTLYVLMYGGQLLVADRLASEVLQYGIGVVVTWTGIVFLAFALGYTGRGHHGSSLLGKVVVITGAIFSGLIVTNPVHGLFLTNFRVEPAFGAGTVLFTKGPLLFVHSVFMLGCLGAAFAMLIETVLAFGPLYRKQALALALTPLFPTISYIVWLVEIGPYPELHLTAFMLLPHLLLDTYALFGGNMFEFPPATRRAGERAAIEDLGTPVVIVDNRGRIIDLNAAARSLFEVTKTTVLATPVAEVIGSEVDLDSDESTVAITIDDRRREFKILPSPFGTRENDVMGYSVVLQDVTVENQRRERLAVLNRILRHNLRNDLSVVTAYTEELARTLEDAEQVSLAEEALDITKALLDMGEKARGAADALDSDRDRRPIALAPLFTSLAADIATQYEGEVTVDIEDDLVVRSDERLLELVFENAVENALEHGGPRPTVEVTAERGEAQSAIIHISDDGPGIPDHERRVVRQGEESALEHGSGVGLWLIQWGTTALGGEVTYSVDDAGTVVSVRVPGVTDENPDVPR